MPRHAETVSSRHKTKRGQMHRSNGKYFSGIHDIKGIKKNFLNLAEEIKHSSSDGVSVAAGYMRAGARRIKVSGISVFKKMESRIKSKPAQSVAVAFTAGILLSLLFGRKSI